MATGDKFDPIVTQNERHVRICFWWLIEVQLKKNHEGNTKYVHLLRDREKERRERENYHIDNFAVKIRGKEKKIKKGTERA